MPTSEAVLEQLWDDLAQSLAAVGGDPEQQRLYLAKLVLLLAREVGDPATVRRLAAVAVKDLA